MYELFMQDYIDEASDEMNQFLGITERAKDGVFKENFYFRDHMQIPKITKALEKEVNRDRIFEFVGSFMDEHQRELGTSGPVYSFTFGEDQVKFMYEMFDLTPEEILKFYDEMVQDTYYGKISKFFTGWVNNAPHKLMITCVLIDAIQHGYEDLVVSCEYMWAFMEYAILYREFWHTGVKPDLMDYTIEHLGSKFMIKKLNNLKELLYYDAHTSTSFMEDRLKLGDDATYMDYMYRMRNQIKNKLRNISNAYYDNYEAGVSLHTNVSTFDDGSIADQEGHMSNTAQIITKTVNKFVTGGINNAIAVTCAQRSDVDKNIFIGYLNQIYSTKNNRMGKLVENIITIFFTKNPTNTSASGIEFVSFGLSLYRSIGTSKDPLYQEINAILTYWMNEIIQIQNYYQRAGTIINYRRATFDYFVWMINHYNS